MQQQLEGLIRNVYELGVAHASFRRQEELWSDQIDFFQEAIDTYLSYWKEDLAKQLAKKKPASSLEILDLIGNYQI